MALFSGFIFFMLNIPTCLRNLSLSYCNYKINYAEIRMSVNMLINIIINQRGGYSSCLCSFQFAVWCEY